MTTTIYPAIFVSCPCSDSISLSHNSSKNSRLAKSGAAEEEEEEEGQPFNPWSPRASFSLYPLDYLLFCEDCNQVRCPRCVQDEIVCYYCPNCLFEVPSSTVKSEGNRCTRNCFNCPICSASLSVTATGEGQTGPFILLCPHCLWSTKDIDIEFEKPAAITAQLAAKFKAASARTPSALAPSDTTTTTRLSAGSYFPQPPPPPPPDAEESDSQAFARTKAHYLQQKQANKDEFGPSGSLLRLMDMYGNKLNKLGPVMPPMRAPAKGKVEWQELEHLREVDAEEELIQRMKEAGFSGTTSQFQRIAHPHQPKLLDDIRPIAALLRTKRSRRCRPCRHILVKPESKVNAIRYRIRLIASAYIPQLNISRFDPTAVAYNNLQPLSTHQFLLTVTNPLYDPINITLATPEKTPGKHPSTVYILCPEFEVGAATDVWDEALGGGAQQPKQKSKGKKSGVVGTVWETGRNWTTVIIEVVPPMIPEEEKDEEAKVVKIPILVRSVYEAEADRVDAGLGAGVGGKELREKKEHSYWSVIEVGRVGSRVRRVETEVEEGGRTAGSSLGSSR